MLRSASLPAVSVAKAHLVAKKERLTRKIEQDLANVPEKIKSVPRKLKNRYEAHEQLLVIFYAQRGGREAGHGVSDPLAWWRAWWRWLGVWLLLINGVCFSHECARPFA